MWRFNGLTLIEVLVAVVILAVLAGLGLPALKVLRLPPIPKPGA